MGPGGLALLANIEAWECWAKVYVNDYVNIALHKSSYECKSTWTDLQVNSNTQAEI